jgi:hypothetical protein
MSFVGAKTSIPLRAYACAWQDGYHDSLIRSSKQFEYVTDYIQANPVRKQYVEKPEDWDAISSRQLDIIADPWPWPINDYDKQSGH